MSTGVDSNSMFLTTKAMNEMSTDVDSAISLLIEIVNKMSTNVDMNVEGGDKLHVYWCRCYTLIYVYTC